LLRSLADEGRTLLVATHDDRIGRIADRVLDMHAAWDAADAPAVLTATVAAEDVLTLAFADHVSAVLADGSKITASIDTASLRAQPGAAGLPIRLIPKTALAAAQIGQLAQLTIIKKSPF